MRQLLDPKMAFSRKLKKFNPDVILTSGQVTKKILKRYYPSRNIYILGSNKVSSNLIKRKISKEYTCST